MAVLRLESSLAAFLLVASSLAAGAIDAPAAPVFLPLDRAVSSWRREASAHLILTPDQVAAFSGPAAPPRVARCVKLNNYWCIKKAGWAGELAADDEGHVAFSSAAEGAAVAALLLRRYYVDFNRHTALAIISHWAPAQCGLIARSGQRRVAPHGLANTLRARWLAGHARGFAVPVAGRRTSVRRSVVADHISRTMPTPSIVAGLGPGVGSGIISMKPTRPMTLDALLMSSPNAPPSRSMLGMPRHGAPQIGSVSSCSGDDARIAGYAATAAAGIKPGANGDLALFAADGTPTANLSILMANMARVEIGPYGATPALIADGIAQAFKPGRNPDKT